MELFEQQAQQVEKLGPAKLKEFLASRYFDENPLRDGPDALDDRFWDFKSRKIYGN